MRILPGLRRIRYLRDKLSLCRSISLTCEDDRDCTCNYLGTAPIIYALLTLDTMHVSLARAIGTDTDTDIDKRDPWKHEEMLRGCRRGCNGGALKFCTKVQLNQRNSKEPTGFAGHKVQRHVQLR